MFCVVKNAGFGFSLLGTFQKKVEENCTFSLPQENQPLKVQNLQRYTPATSTSPPKAGCYAYVCFPLAKGYTDCVRLIMCVSMLS